jgi:hypothetical protein
MKPLSAMNRFRANNLDGEATAANDALRGPPKCLLSPAKLCLRTNVGSCDAAQNARKTNARKNAARGNDDGSVAEAVTLLADDTIAFLVGHVAGIEIDNPRVFEAETHGNDKRGAIVATRGVQGKREDMGKEGIASIGNHQRSDIRGARRKAKCAL